MRKIYFLIFMFVCNFAIAEGSMQTFTMPKQNENVVVEKIVPSYKLEGGLYKVIDGEETLYLYKEGSNVVIHSTKELVTHCGKRDD